MPVPSPFSMNFNDHQDMPKARSWSFHILSALRKNRNSYLKLAFSMRSLRTSPHQSSFFSFLFCLFVDFLIFRSTREFFTHMETSPVQMKDLYSTLVTIEQWGFFCVPHLLWHGPFIPVADLLAGELSLPVSTTWVCRDRESNSNLPHVGRTLYQMSNKFKSSACSHSHLSAELYKCGVRNYFLCTCIWCLASSMM